MTIQVFDMPPGIKLVNPDGTASPEFTNFMNHLLQQLRQI